MLCEECVAIRVLDFVDYIAAKKWSDAGCIVIPHLAVWEFQEKFTERILSDENARLSTRYHTLYVEPAGLGDFTDEYRDYTAYRSGWYIFRVNSESIMSMLRNRYCDNHDPQVIFEALDSAYASIAGYFNKEQ